MTANDALMIINELARRAGREVPIDRVLRQINVVARFADTNNDGLVTANDALIVINRLSNQSPATAEVEQTRAVDWVLSKDEQDFSVLEEHNHEPWNVVRHMQGLIRLASTDSLHISAKRDPNLW